MNAARPRRRGWQMLLALLLTLPVLLPGEARSHLDLQPAEHAHGSLVQRGAVFCALTTGSAIEQGTALGSLLQPSLQGLVPRMHRLLIAERPEVDAARLQELLSRLSADERQRIETIAAAAAVSPVQLAELNVHLDIACTALLSGLAPGGEAVRMARNLDYIEPGLLGAVSFVHCERNPDGFQFASVTWPGFAGVVSGMNEHGLCVAILINQGGTLFDTGLPLPFVCRRLLQNCTDLETAWNFFQSQLPASGHFIAVCDTQSGAILWRDADGPRRSLASGDQLLWANAPPRPDGSQEPSPRTIRLAELVADGVLTDASSLRRALACVPGTNSNMQAMLFEPATRRLALALARRQQPATEAAWTGLDLRPLWQDQTAGLELLRAEDLGLSPPWPAK